MGPSDYSVKIGIYADYSADIYNDGSFSDVSVYPDGTDDYANSALRIQIQDENGQVTSRVFDDMYYFTMEAYYVKTETGIFFMFSHIQKNDWTADNVYEITNGRIRDLGYVEGTPALIRYEYNYNEDSLLPTARMWLHTMIQVLFTLKRL